MELKVIEDLLEKYFDGETTLEEENMLREYFCSAKVAGHLRNYVPMFRFFSGAREERLDKKLSYKREKKQVYSVVAAAASVVLVAGLFLGQREEISQLGSYENPQLALEKTKQTLHMVSQLMNNGSEDLIYIKEFNTTKNSFLK
ncbi:MAG TPA: hypothetical protein VFM60_04760 [Salinimicrobium sp.]|nr:hypothetical protein [Salinimicrobium sp.]